MDNFHQEAMNKKLFPCILLQTDFGDKDAGIINLYGVCKKVCIDVEVFNLNHTVPKFDICAASKFLAEQLQYWPENTVFTSEIVNPAVPAKRSMCVAKSCNNRYIVAPDNGTLRDILQRYGIEWIRDLSELRETYINTEESIICHGRDVAYCATQVAKQIPNVCLGTLYSCSEIVI